MEFRKEVNEEVKQIKNILAVAGLAAVLATGAYAQRYSGGTTTGTTTGTNTGTTTTTTTTTPTQQNPDPFGLTLAASGAAAAVGYVMRRRRGAS